MQEYKLIDKFDGYKLLDRNGQVIYVQTDDVKKQLSLGNVRIYGLKLSESGRLLTDKSDLKQSSQNTFYGININDFSDLAYQTRPIFACHMFHDDTFGYPNFYYQTVGLSFMDTVKYFSDKKYRSEVDSQCKVNLEKVMKEHNIWYNKYFKASLGMHGPFVIMDVKIESFEKYRDGFITVRDPLSQKEVEIQAAIAYAIMLYKNGYSHEKACREAADRLCLGTAEEVYTKEDMLNSIKAGDTTIRIREGDIKRPSVTLMIQNQRVTDHDREGYFFYNYKQRNLMK